MTMPPLILAAVLLLLPIPFGRNAAAAAQISTGGLGTTSGGETLDTTATHWASSERRLGKETGGSDGDENDTSPAAAHASAGASVSTDKPTYGPDDSIAVTFVDPATTGRTDDWIGIYPSDAATITAAEDEEGRPTNRTTVPHPSVEWLWLCGTRDNDGVGCGGEIVETGTVVFAWEEGGILERPPPPPGEYRAFLVRNTDPPYSVVAASDVFEVVGTDELIDEWNDEEEIIEDLEEELEEGEGEMPGDDDEWMQGWDGVMGSAGAEGSAAEGSVEPEGPAAEEEEEAVVSADKGRYDPASSEDDALIVVAFTNPAAQPDDWIGIYPEESIGEMDGFVVVPAGSADWAYACGDRDCIGAVPESVLSFEADLISPGTYQAVLAMNAPDPPFPVLAMSNPFEVVGDDTGNASLGGGGGGGEGGEKDSAPPAQKHADHSGNQEGLEASTGNGGGSGIRLSKGVVLAVCAALLVGNGIACLWFKHARSSSRADETPTQYGKIELSTYA